MKKALILSTLSLFLFLAGCHQTESFDSSSMLGFEVVKNELPAGWVIQEQEGFSVTLDSQVAKSGKYSLAIRRTSNIYALQPITLEFPNRYQGKKITLSGYLKTEKIESGFAGLAIQTGSLIAVDFLEKYGVVGNTDWKKYEVTLELDSSRNQPIIIGLLFADSGKIWMDDLQVQIDGKEIGRIEVAQPKPFSEKAKNDKAFDNGSNIAFAELTEQKIEDLELLGRVWGFMKYHHPAVATGAYNWDYELFRLLPEYLKASNQQQRDKILIEWIEKYGRIPNCKSCIPTLDDAIVKPDLSWIEVSSIDPELKKLLHTIYANRSQGSHYYIRMGYFVGNPIFTHEKTYMQSELCPDAAFRLLALFRYWNMIHYFFPSKHLTDKDWNTVLKEYIPDFIEADSRLAYELAALRLIGEVCDSHATLSGCGQVEFLRGRGHTPALAIFIENKLVVSQYVDEAEDTPLKKGDIITHIEGKPVEAIVDSMKPYYSASNNAARLRMIGDDILYSNQPKLHINYLSSGKAGQMEIDVISMGEINSIRSKQYQQNPIYRFIGKEIGFVDLKSITCQDIAAIKREFIDTKGIIIDLRCYPPSYVAEMLGSFFVSENSAVGKISIFNPNNPGEFTFGRVDTLRKSEISYKGKLVVLVNEHTQSNAEATAMAFRAGANTTLVGSQTAGADGNVSMITLPGGLTTWISGNGVYYPDGRETQRIGIVPDIEVKPTIEGIREGRDELLEKAIEIINQE